MGDATRILLVDDEKPVVRSMEKTFLRAGFDVQTAPSVPEGLACFRAALGDGPPFDLVIVDLHMPNFDGVRSEDAGFDLLRALLALQPDLPVIVLTAFDAVSKAKHAITLGARDYFVKGRESELLELVRKTLGQ